MPLKNFYDANTVKPGDIFCVTIKVMVQYDGTYRVYRCSWPEAEIGEDGSPKGDAIYPTKSEIKSLQKSIELFMPILGWTGSKPDPTW